LSNALKFTDRDGKILIIVNFLAGAESDSIKISVVDSGIGIKTKHQDKLFKLFGSIKNEKKNINVKGIGLGLAISKLIVQKFKGSIDFISKYKHGSTFFYTFKLCTFDKA
jgi:signal transduction histidine kinase